MITTKKLRKRQKMKVKVAELNEKTFFHILEKDIIKKYHSFDELLSERETSEELPEDVSAYFKYKKETGRGIKDYVKLNRDFDEMQPDSLLSIF